jgi:hypothetical protein
MNDGRDEPGWIFLEGSPKEGGIFTLQR